MYFRGENCMTSNRIGVLVGIVALTKEVAIGRMFASMKDYQVTGNKEMMVLEAMNGISL